MREKVGRRAAVAAIGGALVVGNRVSPASAGGFGPAGGAAQSGAPAKQLSLDQFERLSPKKQAQVEKGLVGQVGTKQASSLLKELKEASSQSSTLSFDAVLEQLKQELSPTLEIIDQIKELEEKRRVALEEREKADKLARELAERQELLAKLDSQVKDEPSLQPVWVA